MEFTTRITKHTMTFLVMAVLGFSFNVNAGFAHTDWQVSGDRKAMLHEETGLEWLKFSNTLDMSINEVSTLLDTTYDGWRLPSANEVRLLMGAFFDETLYPDGESTELFSAEQRAIATDFVSFMSATQVNSGARYVTSSGWFSDGTNTPLYSDVFYFTDSATKTLVRKSQVLTGYDLDLKNYTYGVFLVSDGGTTLSSQLDPSINANNPNAPTANVSVPALFGAMLAFFGTGLVRRKIKNA